MEKKNKKNTHISIRDGNGRDYLCPYGSVRGTAKTDVDFDVCVEKDVPGRYAARITVQES